MSTASANKRELSPRPLRARCRCAGVAYWRIAPADVGKPCWTCKAPLTLLPKEDQR